MPTVYTLVGRTLRSVATVSPAFAGRLAIRAFFATAPRIAVRDADVATDLAARSKTLRIRGRDLAVYEWGAGEDVVLLVHGWRGRASQFAPLVRELVADGLRVIAFDAPAHGRSAGGRTDIRDWIAAVAALHTSDGPFRAVVGHSLGGLAVLTAGRSGIPVGRVAVVAATGSADPFIPQFAREFALDSRTEAHTRARFHARLGEDEATMSARYDAVADPLPDGTELLVVHDSGDRRMPRDDAERLHAAHGPRSRMLLTSGFGHTRVLASDAFLDAMTSFASGGLDRVDEARLTEAAALVTTPGRG